MYPTNEQEALDALKGEDPELAATAEALLWRIWCASGNLEADRVFRAGVEAMQRRELAVPDLAPAQERKADEAAHVEFLAAVLELQSGAIDFAGPGVEDFSALIFVPLPGEAPHEVQSDDRLVAAGPFAFRASGIGVFARVGKNLFDPALVLAVDQLDPYQAARLARVVVDGLPQADRRGEIGGAGRKRKRQRKRRHDKNQSFHPQAPDAILSRLMLVDLPPGLEAAAQARDVFKPVFQKIGGGAEAAVAVVAVDDHLALLVRAFDELSHVAVVQVNGAGDVGGAVRARVADVHEQAVPPVEFFLRLVDFYLRNLAHGSPPFEKIRHDPIEPLRPVPLHPMGGAVEQMELGAGDHLE